MTGPVTAKLLVPGMVLVRGTETDLHGTRLPTDRQRRLPPITEIAKQPSAKYTLAPSRV